MSVRATQPGLGTSMRATRGRTRAAVLLATAAAIGATIAAVVIYRDRAWEIVATVLRAQWGWVGSAMLAQVFSIGALARQQRRLLTASGQLLPLPSVVATTFVGGALSQSIPLVGKGMAAMYSFRRFTSRGVQPAIVGWALAMSALYLILAFLALSAFGAIITGRIEAIATGVVALVALIVPAWAILTALRREKVRHAAEKAISRAFAGVRRVTNRPLRRIHDGLQTAVAVAATAHLGARGTALVIGWSLLNFTATVTCLILSILAVGGTVPWSVIVVVWAAAAGLGQLGLTPGGIGVVDAALIIGLASAGMPMDTAIAATIVYRAISLYLAVATGGLTFLATARTGRKRTAIFG